MGIAKVRKKGIPNDGSGYCKTTTTETRADTRDIWIWVQWTHACCIIV